MCNFYNQGQILLKNQTTQVYYKVRNLLLLVLKLAPRAEAASGACGEHRPGPRRHGSEGPALLLVEY